METETTALIDDYWVDVSPPTAPPAPSADYARTFPRYRHRNKPADPDHDLEENDAKAKADPPPRRVQPMERVFILCRENFELRQDLAKAAALVDMLREREKRANFRVKRLIIELERRQAIIEQQQETIEYLSTDQAEDPDQKLSTDSPLLLGQGDQYALLNG